METSLVVYWCRRDFRLLDNPAFSEALDFSVKHNLKLLPIFVLDDNIVLNNTLNIGFSRRLLLSKILYSFDKKLDKKLLIFCGKPVDIFEKLSAKFDLKVFVNEDIEPYSLKRDLEIKSILIKNNSTFFSFKDQITVNKELKSGSGTTYSVFTPFRNSSLQSFLESRVYPKVNIDKVKGLFSEIEEIKSIDGLNILKKEDNLQDQIFRIIDRPNILYLNSHVKINIDDIFSRPNLDFWYYDEDLALSSAKEFVKNKISSYKENRDDMGLDTFQNGQTSRLSSALKWGLISARSIKNEILITHGVEASLKNENIFSYISELMWREFYRYILFHHPFVLNLEFQERFREKIDWLSGESALENFRSWIKGETGYPLVDAAMHQLSQTGWLHNRARMLVASILTKNLGIDWRWGQDYFRMVLVDLDEASNNGGWQWAASVGADPKPIRIFNPYLQAEKYDSKKLYQNKWLPKDYSIWQPIIEHKLAREKALVRYGLKPYKIRDF